MKNKTIIGIIIIVLVIAAIVWLELDKVVEKEEYTNPTVVLNEPAEENNTNKSFTWTNPNAENFKPDPNSKYEIAPELEGISGWINSEPFELKELRGKVVIVDFWTYTCINCIRTLPYLTAWDEKYREDGLVIIGVHTPEFAFEKKTENVLNAVEKYGIEYPVVQDNDYRTWRAYQNRFWPHKFLIDKNGHIRYDHIGEGGYAETEVMIQELLAETGVEKEGGLVDVDEKTPNTRNTPELYAGYDFALPRGQNVANGGLSPGETKIYEIPDEDLTRGRIYLEGSWKSNPDDLEAVTDGAVVLVFTARSANIVADSEGTIMKVYVNDQTESSGSDVVDGEVVVDEPVLYNVFDDGYGTRTLRLKVEKGFTFSAFTFG